MELNTETKEKELTLEKRFEAILFQFTTLYGALEDDRKNFIQQSTEFHQLKEALKTEIYQLKKIEDTVKTQLHGELVKTGKEAIQKLSQVTAEALVKEGKQLNRDLNHTVSQAKNALAQYQIEDRKQSWINAAALFGTVILTGILASLLTGLFFIPKYEPTEAQKKYIQNGQALERIWPKLTKKEKQKLEKLTR